MTSRKQKSLPLKGRERERERGREKKKYSGGVARDITLGGGDKKLYLRF
jgi:hypothetical protein